MGRPPFLQIDIYISDGQEPRSGYDRATGSGSGRATGPGNPTDWSESLSNSDRATGTGHGRATGFGRVVPCLKSYSGHDRFTGLASSWATGSGPVSNCREPRSGYDRATGSGRPMGLGDISHGHWPSYFDWACRSNRGNLTFYTIPRGFHFTQTGLGKGPVEVIVRMRWLGLSFFRCRPGGKAFSQRRKGVTMGSWTPRVRASRFPPGTDRMSLAGRISLSKLRETGVGCPIGRRSISVLLGPADPLAFPAVFCVPNDWNS